MKYLINNGKPFQKTIYMQRYDSWMEDPKSVRRKIIETIIPNREGMGKSDYKPGGATDNESAKARQLGLLDGDKAWIYYEDDGREVSKIFQDGKILPTKTITHVDKSFTITCYPHIARVTLGAPGRMTEKRKYEILVGKMAEIENTRDLDELLKTFHFLDECNEKAEVIKKNPYYEKEDRNPVPDKPYPSMGPLPDSQIPKESPNARDISQLREGEEEMIEEAK